MYRRIRDLREDKDLKQKDLAKHLGCSQTTYSDYETGKIHVPLETLIELSRFYQISVDYLLDLTDERKPYPRHEKRQVNLKSFRIRITTDIILQVGNYSVHPC